jgi:hypothetical protein
MDTTADGTASLRKTRRSRIGDPGRGVRESSISTLGLFAGHPARTLLWGLVLAAIAVLPPDRCLGQDAAPASPAAVPERTIFVPYQNLEAILKGQAASAIVPYEEYLKFIGRGETTGPKLPVQAVIAESAYVAQVEDDLARITATYKVRVLGKPWVELPLTFGEAAVGKVDAGEADVLLRGTGDGTYALLLGKEGEQTVTIELVARIRSSPDGREFSLAVPPVGITTFELTVPQADQSVEVEPRLVSLPAEAAGEAGGTRVKASLGSTRTITAKWRPRASTKPEMDLLASVESRQLVTIDGGLVHHDAWLTWNVLRGNLTTVEVAVPLGQRILDVTANVGVKSWQAKDEAQRQLVTVELLAAAQSAVTIEVHTEGTQAESSLVVAGMDEAGAVFGIHAVGAVRESGQVAVRAGDDIELAVTDQQGLSRIAADAVPQELKPSAATAFKFYSPQFRLAVTARPIEPRVLVAQESRLIFDEDELRLQADLRYQVERAGVFELTLLVPAGLTIDDVQSPQMEAETFDDASRTLTVRLRQRTTGEIVVSVKAHQPLDAAASQAGFDLPVLEPQNVARETGTVYVFAPPAIEVVTSDDGLQAVQPAPAPADAQQGDATLTAAWSYTRRPIRIPVSTTRKPTRLSATIATSIDVQPETVEVTTLLDYVVEFAGVDTFRFLVPEAVSATVQIDAEAVGSSSAAIKQKSPGPAENGWVPWTVVMQRDVVGGQRFRITYRLTGAGAAVEPAAPASAAPSGAKPPAAPQTIAVQLIRPQGTPGDPNGEAAIPLTQLKGEVRVSKERSLSVTGAAAGGDVEPIDIRELTLVPAEGALAFRYFRQPDDGAITVDLTKQRHEIQEVVPTVVEKALVEIATGRHAAATYRCRYRVRTVERQRLRIDLPKELDLLGVFIDGTQERLNPLDPAEAGSVPKDVAAYSINIARSANSDQTFLLTLQFNWNVNPPPFESPYGRGSITFPLPRIGGSVAPAQVQESRTIVYVPDRFWLVGTPDRFTVLGQRAWWEGLGGNPRPDEHSGSDWIGDATSVLQFPTEGLRGTTYSSLGRAPEIEVVWWDTVKMTILFSLALALMAFILLRTSWENKLGILLLLAFVAMLFGVRDADALAHGLAAARFGLLFLLALWLLHGLLGRNGPSLWSNGPTPWSKAGAYAVSPPPTAPSSPPGDK